MTERMSTTEGARVLIAEDEAIIRLDLRELLEEEGYEVVGEVGDGDEAVRLAEELRPDVTILDIKMPGTDGLTAAREIVGQRWSAVLRQKAVMLKTPGSSSRRPSRKSVSPSIPISAR